ncbi:MAG: hypothetical protein QM761_14545 [Pseudoxanthomonas sp.]
MNMHQTALLLGLLASAGAFAFTPADADAQGRIRGRVVAHGAEGGRATVVGAAARSPNGAFARGHGVASDGQGNVKGGHRGKAVGVNGGEASSQGGFYRNADGSAGRQGGTRVSTAAGGSLDSSGGFTKAADGAYSGSHQTSTTGAHGNSYEGSTTYSNGQVTHTGACTNAAGETIACPTRGN